MDCIDPGSCQISFPTLDKEAWDRRLIANSPHLSYETRARFFYSPDDDGTGGDGSDGSQTVTVGSDDSILSIAKQNGFYWSTLWNHPKNSQLKSLRKKPEVLQEGDQVYVPKIDPKKESNPTRRTTSSSSKASRRSSKSA